MSARGGLTKAELRALGRLFAAEIEGRIPMQSRAAIYPELAERGLVQWVERVLGGHGPSPIERIPIRISGWALTSRGHLTYCASCADADESARGGRA